MPVFVGAGTSSFMKGSDGIGVSSKTTAQRNAGINTVSGTIIYNSSIATVEAYTNNKWVSMSNNFTASGGATVESGGYKYHTFTSSGTFTANSSGSVDILMVAGGGSGGPGTAGGGGAGGVLYTSGKAINTGT